MGALDDLYAPEPTAPAPKAKPRPKAAAPAAGMGEDKFLAIMEDPSNLPSISKAGFSADQEKRFRDAWPMTNLGADTGGHEKSAKLLKTLDQLADYGERVFSAPKVDKHAREAVEKYYAYLSKKKKPEAGGESNLLETAKELFVGPEVDPIEKLKGPARQQAADLRDLTDRLAAAKAIGGGNADELHILTAMLPAPGDTPEAAKNKRRAFANEVEGMAQGMAPQFWRGAAKHIAKARRLRGPADKAPAPGAAAKAPQAAAEAPEEGKGMHWALRSAVKGATGLALPVMAAIRAAMDSTPEERASGADMAFAPHLPPADPGAIPRGKGFGEHAADLRDVRAQNMGFPDAASEEAEAEDHSAVGRFGATVAGGMLDPTNVLLGLPAKAVAGLSPMVRAALAHAAPSATAGGLAAAGEGADAMGVLKGAGAGALIGTAIGKGAEAFLGSGSKNALARGVAEKEARASGGTLADVAAREAQLRDNAYTSPSVAPGDETALLASTGNKHAQAELPFKLNEWRDKLLAKHNVQPGSKLETQLGLLEDAIDSGDVEHIVTLRKVWDDHWAKSPNISAGSAALKKDIDALLDMRALSVAAEGAGHGHGAVSDATANRNPIATVANADAGTGAQITAGMHLGAEGMGDRALKAIVMSRLTKPLKQGMSATDAALARLHMARQTGNMSQIQQAVEHALKVGLPFSMVSKIANSIGAPSDD
jgi:hypothetical protein